MAQALRNSIVLFAFLSLLPLFLSPLPPSSCLAQETSESSSSSSGEAAPPTLMESSSSSGAADEINNSSSSTAAWEPIFGNSSSSSTGGTGNSTTGNFTSSTGGAGPNTTQHIDFGHYVCGYQEVNTTQGYYENGLTWEQPGDNYIDLSNDGNSTTPRGYPQCYGHSENTNCFDQKQSTPFKYHVGQCGTATNGSAEYVKGVMSTPICVVFGGGNRLYRTKFFPNVDEFALVTLQGSFNGTNSTDKGGGISGIQAFGHLGTAFQVEINGVVSDIRHRYRTVINSACTNQIVNGTIVACNYNSAKMCAIVPFHTIVINMDNGVISSIDFDDDCSLCSSDYCVDGNCAQDITTCKDFKMDGVIYDSTATTDCDFKLYISWSGTDSQGTYLSSAGRRLSQFRRWSLRSVYNQATNFPSDIPVAVAPDAKI